MKKQPEKQLEVKGLRKKESADECGNRKWRVAVDMILVKIAVKLYRLNRVQSILTGSTETLYSKEDE